MVRNSIDNQLIVDGFYICDLKMDWIGRWFIGDVYRARNTQTGELVAVQALNPRAVARSPEILERFVPEGESLRRLNHPDIARMVAAMDEVEATISVVAHYLIIEYVTGGSRHDSPAAQGALTGSGTVHQDCSVAAGACGVSDRKEDGE